MRVGPLFYFVFAMVALSALYAALRPSRASDDKPRVSTAQSALSILEPTSGAAAAAAQKAGEPTRVLDAKPVFFDVVIQNGRRISEPGVLKVHQGDEVILRITSDRADELHLHGYNLHASLTPGKTAALQFTATLTGRFTYELHKAELQLGAVEVYPR